MSGVRVDPTKWSDRGRALLQAKLLEIDGTPPPPDPVAAARRSRPPNPDRPSTSTLRSFALAIAAAVAFGLVVVVGFDVVTTPPAHVDMPAVDAPVPSTTRGSTVHTAQTPGRTIRIPPPAHMKVVVEPPPLCTSTAHMTICR